MKHSVAVKFIAIILCALSLVACVGGALGIIVNENYGLYTDGPRSWLQGELENIGFNIAYGYSQLYAAEHLGNCPPEVLDTLRSNYYLMDSGGWSVTLLQDGEVLVEGDSTLSDAVTLTYTIDGYYPAIWNGEPIAASEAVIDQGTSDTTEPTAAQYPHSVETIWVEDAYGSGYAQEIAYYEGPEYQVVVYLQPTTVDSFMVSFIGLMYELRNHFIALLFAGLLVFAATLVYLCCAAGRRPGSDQVYPVALNRIPLDLYASAVLFLEYLLAWVIVQVIREFGYSEGNWALVSLLGLLCFAAALIVVAFIFAFAAQLKTKGGFWWRRTIIGFLLIKLGRGLRWVGRGCAALFELLPLVWQWLVAALFMGLCPLAFLFFAMVAYGGWAVIWLGMAILAVLADIAIIAHWAYSMGQLMKGVKVMSHGGLHYQIPTRHLTGKFKKFAMAINSMAGAARIAAERQLKSERMKTELITNVSHDIKTPLTSIINYVDLLKKPHDAPQEQQYLEVLDRQSQRLKKLIDDLMEMSKASTGNIAVEMGRVDAVEAINQAMGEFSDKLEGADLIPVFRCPQAPVLIRADGKLLWRVMSNLLSNAVKYAMPGTRLYMDLLVIQGNAVLNMKNISRDQLNVNADELMERFVRGDTSRNTEGSGLGLNIAKSLVELQKGQMHLMVDGDLFKVTMVFPLA